MVGRVVGTLAAASALGAQAFLLPAEVHKDKKLSPFVAQALPQEWQAVSLPCSECVVPTEDTEIKEETDGDSPMFIQGGANSLLVNVTTILDRHAIGISGQHTVYPPLEDTNQAVVHIVPSSGERRHAVKVSAESLLVGEDVISTDGEVMIQIFYQIESVDNHPVSVDPVKITAIKGLDDELAIISVETVDSGRPSHAMPLPFHGFNDVSPPRPHQKPCAWPSFICQARDFVEAKFSGGMAHGARVGGCGGSKAAHKSPKGRKGPKGPKGDEMFEEAGFPFGDDDKAEPPHGKGHHGKGPRPPHHEGEKGGKPKSHPGKHHDHDDDETERSDRPAHHHKGEEGEGFEDAAEGRGRHHHHEDKDGERDESDKGAEGRHPPHHPKGKHSEQEGPDGRRPPPPHKGEDGKEQGPDGRRPPPPHKGEDGEEQGPDGRRPPPPHKGEDGEEEGPEGSDGPDGPDGRRPPPPHKGKHGEKEEPATDDEDRRPPPHHKGEDNEESGEGHVRPHHHHHENKDDVDAEFQQDESAPARQHGQGSGSKAWRGHHHHQSKMQRAARAALMILTPIFLGITMGMAVSVLGMALGRLITFLWTRFVRGGQKGYASVQLSEEAAEQAEAGDLPPVYGSDEKAGFQVAYKDDVEESQ